MYTYLEHDHPDAFLDYPEEQSANVLRMAREQGMTQRCHVCHGHGGWNLRLNAYPLHDREDTSENRHKFSHFKCNCGQCNGWGWIKPDSADAKCEKHEWKHVRATGRCLHLYECQNCGKQHEVDSSD